MVAPVSAEQRGRWTPGGWPTGSGAHRRPVSRTSRRTDSLARSLRTRPRRGRPGRQHRRRLARAGSRGGGAGRRPVWHGHMPPPLDPETAHALAFTPTEDLPALPVLGPDAVPNSGSRLRDLQAGQPPACPGRRRHLGRPRRPGQLHQPRHHPHPAGPRRDVRPRCRGLPEDDPGLRRRRVGTADEVATAAAFLLGPDAGFITGTDLLMDGGVIAALRAGRWQLGM